MRVFGWPQSLDPSPLIRARRLQVFLYIMPGRWYIASLVKTEFSGTLFDGASLVDNPAPGQDAYVCDPGVASCFGRTGDQVGWPARAGVCALAPRSHARTSRIDCDSLIRGGPAMRMVECRGLGRTLLVNVM